MITFLMALSSSAHAGDVIHVAAGHAWTQRFTRDAAQLGPVLQLDVGYGKGIGIGKIIPEAGLGLAYGSGALIPRVGARAILGWLVTPGVYAHANVALGGPFGAAPGFDGGITLDLSLPFVRVGGFAGVQVFGGASGPDIPDQNFVGGIELVLSLPTTKD